MKREHIISQLYQVINTTVNRTLNKQKSFGHTLTLDGDPWFC